jgi:hypothetical protein
VVAEEEFAAWMATLRKNYSVEINMPAPENKDR